MGDLAKFFEKINFTNFDDFKSTIVDKVVVHKLDNTWTVHITNKEPVNVDAIESLKTISRNGFDEVKSVDFVINNEKYCDQDILSYIKYYLNYLSKKSPALSSLKGNDIIVVNKEIKVEVTNSVESGLIKSNKNKILSWLENMGLGGCSITTYTNIDKRNKVKAEIESVKTKCEEINAKPLVALAERHDKPVLEVKGEALYGTPFDSSKIVAINDITGEKRGVNIHVKITDIKAIESARTDYKIFTIKVSDGKPFTAKLFTTDREVYLFLLKNLKENNWYYMRGSVQNDNYMHSLVFTIRSIMESDKKEEPINEANDFSYMDYPEYIPEDIPDDTGYSDDAFFALSDMPYEEEVISEPIIPIAKDPAPKKVETNAIKEKVTGKLQKMQDVIAPTNSAIFETKIFGVDLFESPKNNFKIITLKLTDKTDSFLCKIFTKNADEFKAYSKKYKKGTWIKVEGQVKYDEYAKDLVLNARSIEVIDSKDEILKDDAENKRIELHAHTMMSQMDGVLNVNEYLDTMHNMGYKACAITDHNGVQAFPDAFHKVCDFNKGIEKEEDKFKCIYGAELTMVEDSVDIVRNPKSIPSLDATYCVFDLETTGFNAGGEDSIIEIGAVLIKNGNIIEKFDELINPGRKLPKKITELTGITDEMLEDKISEEEALKKFIDFKKDYPMVAHNAKFDCSFIDMGYKKYNLGTFDNPVIDTLELSRALDSGFARHSLSALVKRYNVEWNEDEHHRGDYDAEGTARVFDKMLNKMYNQNIEDIKDFNNLVSSDDMYKYGRTFHINLLVKNKVGLKNLFKLISFANTKYLYKTPRIPRSEVEKYREGLLIGSGCYQSEVFVEAKSKSDEELSNIISFYDYVEVQPPKVYSHMIDTSDFGSYAEIESHLTKIINTTIDAGKIIVATGDVHHLRKEDKISREIIVNQKVPGGGRHPLAKSEINSIPSQHFRTTDEMLKDFSFLDKKLAKEIVIDNTNKIADLCEIVEVIIDTGGVPFSPKFENSEKEVKDMVYGRAHEIYGDSLPELIETRIENELTGIIKGGFDVIYLIAQKLVKHSNDEGYLVGSRGSVGSSFVATMMGITEVNPLPAHYVCPKCKHSIFEMDGKKLSDNYSCGYDLPDLKCPKCGEDMHKEGQDMPFATFLGFDADKVPDIDLNFSGDNQASAHEYTKELFGVDNVYRAGTIGTVAEKTAYGFVKGYCEEKNITNMKSVEMERLAEGCTGVKRTTGQHPGGIVVIPNYMDVYDFTPYQYPADDANSAWRTTHFDYHAIDQDVLKLDILGHDDPTVLRMLKDLSGIDVTKVPLDDKDTMSIFTSPDILGVDKDKIMCSTGTLGIPEFGTRLAVRMLEDTKPTTFAELVKISGLSHGTDVWYGNSRDLIQSGEVEFKDVIGCRDDIMLNLIFYGMESKKAFKIMEFVRKGKASKDPEKWAEFAEEMKAANVPEWYINSCQKIKYMFPKAHAAAYVISAFRIAWFKVHHPIYYYASYFSVRANAFDVETMCKGYDAIKKKLEEINEKGYDAGNKEVELRDELAIALEMCARGFKFKMIDLYKSDWRNFVIDEDEKTLIFPFRALDGLGENVSISITEERSKSPFLSIEDVQLRAKVNSTTIDKMKSLGIFDGMSESNQMSLFDGFF